ncbi:MAG: hypothetical protein J7K00_05330 [Candidatus Diapherotrites archaeon]|nr:hypothetical protein [Candidatus Diapherotrites archaeon]
MDTKTTILLVSALIIGLYLGGALSGLLIEADPMKLGRGSPHEFFLMALKSPNDPQLAGPFLLQQGERICESEFVSGLDIPFSDVTLVYEGEAEFAEVVGSDGESRGQCLRARATMNFLAHITCSLDNKCRVVFYPRTDL